jgi:uncharacterized protein (DUF2147 family)
MRRILTLLFVFFITLSTFAQGITGQWETFDDETNEKKALIEIYAANDKYFAKIVESYVKGSSGKCEKCQGAKKNKPIQGLVIIENLEKDDDEYTGGIILDPENGKTYKCYVELLEKNKLKVRGYLGFSLLGRTQYWRRKID